MWNGRKPHAQTSIPEDKNLTYFDIFTTVRIFSLRSTGFGWSKIDYLREWNITRIILPENICDSLFHRNKQGTTLCGFQNAAEIFVAKFCLNSYVLVSVYREQYMFYWCIVNLSIVNSVVA